MPLNLLLKESSTTKKDLAIAELFDNFMKFKNSKVQVLPSKIVDGQNSLTASEAIPSGTLIFSYTNYIISIRTRTSIQVGPNKHIEAGSFGKYTNHSCNSNSIIETKIIDHKKASVLLLTIRDILPNEEITFDYATTENILTQKASELSCLCGTKNCRGRILGFDNITTDQKEQLINNNRVASHLLKY